MLVQKKTHQKPNKIIIKKKKNNKKNIVWVLVDEFNEFTLSKSVTVGSTVGNSGDAFASKAKHPQAIPANISHFWPWFGWGFW